MSFDNLIALRPVGDPQPQGSISYKGHRGGKPIMTSANDNLKPWRAIVAQAAQEALPPDWQPLDEPVMISAKFWVKRPLRPVHELPDRNPDLDKLLRAVLDALETAGVYVNDSRVTDFGRISERYTDEHNPVGALIVVEWGDF